METRHPASPGAWSPFLPKTTRASRHPLRPLRGIEFFKCFFEMQHAVVTTQVEEVATQISFTCTVIIEDNQPLPRALHPPASQLYQPTIIETCCKEYLYLIGSQTYH